MRSTGSTPTLADVCEFVVDCLHATAPIQETGYPLIRTPNIGKGVLVLDDVYRVSEPTYRKWIRRATPIEGDLILAREAPAGNVAIIKSGQTVCLGQRTVHLRPDRTQVDPQYLCYFLLTPKQQGLLLAGETGATAKHVNMKDIRKLPLEDLPDIGTQKKTAEFLTGYDDLIENNRRRIALLEQAARLLYEEWFVRFRFPGHEHAKFINGLPYGWTRPLIGDYAPLLYGKALRDDQRAEGEVPVYGSSGRVGTHNKPLVEPPGIIVGRKGNVGAVYFSEEPFWPIDTTYFVGGPNVSRFLFYALQRSQFISTDVAVPGLNRDFAHSRQLIVPTDSILSQYEEKVAPHFKMMRLLERQNAQLQAARDLLLPRLMSGEVEV